MHYQRALRGINLGGWLVLERWMTPSLFEGTSAHDEWTLGQAKGDDAMRRLLDEHRRSFITSTDISAIASAGFEVVRLPIGYWAFLDQDGFYECSKYIEALLEWAHGNQLRVIIDLHAAPGSQNGWDHSGRAGEVRWHRTDGAIDATLEVVEEVARRYGRHSSLYGVEVLNEPRWDVPISTLVEYYKKAAARLRTHSAEDVRVIVSDSFRLSAMMDALADAELDDIMIDTHLYQVFSDEDRALTLEEHIEKVSEWRSELRVTRRRFEVLVGEWSAALDPQTFSGMTKGQEDEAIERYYHAQQDAFDDSATAWCYWAYKTEHLSPWSYRSQTGFSLDS